MSAMATSAYEWRHLPWKDFEAQVFKLQKRIYRASQRDDDKTVHRLQRLLMRSRAARCIAVRRVSQDNRGKRTAGVDGVKNLPPAQRLHLAETLRLDTKPRPVRRVWIPKPGKPEQRSLGIPTVSDRATQTLVRLALEPEWEARFEPNSYGFRPGRSCHDAIAAIYTGISQKPRYVLDADIAACFDRINHSALVVKLQTFPALRRAITGWLRTGIMDGPTLFSTTEGTPQGGPLSPLLANIALHGLETTIRDAFPVKQSVTRISWKPLVIRYADDFVVMHEDLAVIEQVRQITSEWLQGMGLELKPSKTRITHTLRAYDGTVGFDFLGFTIRQYPVGKHRTGTNCAGRPLGFKTLIKPSPASVKQHYQDLAVVIERHRQIPVEGLIAHLNPKIVGWANYYSAVVAAETFQKLDHLVYRKLRRWTRRRHPKKGAKWVARHYWHTRGSQHWVFGPRNGTPLARHGDTPIRRHTKVRGQASPYNGDWIYWATRLGRHPELPGSSAKLLKAQQGKCAYCGLLFIRGDEVIEADHTHPTSLGGGMGWGNRQLLHGHCHDQKTARDGSHVPRPSEVPVSRAKIITIEEPDEEKSSRPVL
jgi:RNA-directed DNA polymerase